MASSALKDAAVEVMCFMLAQAFIVGRMVQGVAPPPPHAPPSLARCAAGLWHRQRMVVLHEFSYLAVVASVLVAFAVRHHRKERPTTGIRATMLLAVALSLAATVLHGATLFYVQQVSMGADFSCFSGAARAASWASYVLLGVLCACRHYDLVIVAIWSD